VVKNGSRGAIALLAVGILTLAAPPAGADHWETYAGPEEPSRDFPPAFMEMLPVDSQAKGAATPWEDPRIGGWGGGSCPRAQRGRTPVIFVHGNGGHAGHWSLDVPDGQFVNVRQHSLAAGYCARQLWAMSYDGAGSYSTYNDVNVPDVYLFIKAVRRYLGVRKVDVVAHSLGVTVFRKAAFVHPGLYKHVRRFVAIAGATEGTTTCRGTAEQGLLHVCDEVAPGSEWLAELNSIGHTPRGPKYLTLYDGTGTADDFYLGPDALSPQLRGACNHPLPFLDHFSLGWSPQAVEVYLAFVRDGRVPSCDPYGQAPDVAM
jgi:pimeloyl-ACP methyl ester carboxylesterase